MTEADLTAMRAERDELRRLLLDVGGYIGSDLFIAASNASDTAVKCEQLKTQLAEAEADFTAERDRYREALEAISQIADGYWCAHKDIARAALDGEG